MLNTGIENDSDVRTALNWFADASGDAAEFWLRVNEASKTYRLAALTLPEKFGKDLLLEELGSDKAASYFAQAAALLQDRQSYDLNLGSKIVPFIKHLGSSIELLEKIPGAKERARRLLCQSSSEPESTIFELAVALRYAKDGFSVQFIPEDPGGKRLPDFHINHEDFFADVECKRLRKSSYEKEEATFQQQIFSSFSKMVNELELSVNVDVIYTQELKTIPVDYLCGWTKKAINCRFLLSDGFPWKDEASRTPTSAQNRHIGRE